MKKLLKFMSICAALVVAVCCINTKTASAAEQTLNYTYSDNLYSGIYWRIDDNTTDYYSIDNDFTGSTDDDIYTNIMKIENRENDLVLCMEFNLQGLTYDKNSFSAIGLGATKLLYLDENFEIIGIDYIKHRNNDDNVTMTTPANNKVSTSNFVDNTYTVRCAMSNPALNNSNVKYFAIAPKLYYNDLSGNNILLNGKYIENMLVCFTRQIKSSDYAWLQRVQADLSNLVLTPYDSGFEFTGIEDNYLAVSVLEDATIQEVVNNIEIYNEFGERCTIKSGSFLPEQIHITGGKYDYICVASDSEGNEESFVVSLNVADLVPPTISGAVEFNVPVGSLLSINTIKNSLVVSDNLDNAEDITISTKYDYYTSNYQTPGTYYVCFEARDTNNNSSEIIVKINVLDKNGPTFYDSNNTPITKYKVQKSLDSVLVMSDIIKNIKAIDVVDGELEIKVYSDKYTGKGDTPGKYLVVLIAKDSSGNISYLNVNIEVSDILPSKTIVIDDRYVLVEKSVRLTKNDFHTLIALTSGYDNSTTSYTSVNTDFYSPYYNIEGDYLVDYEVVSTNGYEDQGVFTVTVIQERSNGNFVNNKVEEQKDGIIVSILKWIWNLIVSIFNWFMGLFE